MTRREQALAYFVRMGWTSVQAAGIVANLEAESGLRPDAVGDGGQAYGIAQWHPDRQTNFAAVIGRDIRGSSFEDQLAFVHAELNNWEKAAGDALRATTTAAEAGAVVSRRYERPADTEGEAQKRGRLAETIAAAVPEGAPEIPPEAGTQETHMGAGLIIGLVNAALQAFAPLAQQKIQQEIGRHTDKTTAEQVAGNVMAAIQNATGKTGSTPEAMIAATAAITDPATPKEVVQKAQEDALARLEQLAPFVDKLAALDQATWTAEEVSKDAAAARAHVDTVDLATPLTYAGLTVIGLLILFVGAIIIVQMIQSADGKASTEAWAALTGLIGWATGQTSLIYAYRFGTTRTSGAKDVLISELARSK